MGCKQNLICAKDNAIEDFSNFFNIKNVFSDENIQNHNMNREEFIDDQNLSSSSNSKIVNPSDNVVFNNFLKANKDNDKFNNFGKRKYQNSNYYFQLGEYVQYYKDFENNNDDNLNPLEKKITKALNKTKKLTKKKKVIISAEAPINFNENEKNNNNENFIANTSIK